MLKGHFLKNYFTTVCVEFDLAACPDISASMQREILPLTPSSFSSDQLRYCSARLDR